MSEENNYTCHKGETLINCQRHQGFSGIIIKTESHYVAIKTETPATAESLYKHLASTEVSLVQVSSLNAAESVGH